MCIEDNRTEFKSVGAISFENIDVRVHDLYIIAMNNNTKSSQLNNFFIRMGVIEDICSQGPNLLHVFNPHLICDHKATTEE